MTIKVASTMDYLNPICPIPGPYGDDLYTCDCTTAYKGVDCEIKKDFCEEFQFPCQNGATCHSIDATYVRNGLAYFVIKCQLFLFIVI